jgi:hypothetical protein
MEDAQTILVIITSSLLALFLLIGIVLMVMVVRLVSAIKRISYKAEGLIDSAESVTEAFKNVSGPLALAKLVKNIVSLVNKHK